MSVLVPSLLLGGGLVKVRDDSPCGVLIGTAGEVLRVLVCAVVRDIACWVEASQVTSVHHDVVGTAILRKADLPMAIAGAGVCDKRPSVFTPVLVRLEPKRASDQFLYGG